MYEIRSCGGGGPGDTGYWMPYVCDRPVSWARNVLHNGEGIPRPDDWPYEQWHAMRVRGFHTPLENGLILSTQWGEGNYCANHEPMLTWEQPEGWQFMEACPDAELACWWASDPDRDRMLEWPDGDVVLGYFFAECWWELLHRLALMRTGSDLLDTPAVKELIEHE